jgi:hypothetical protein
MSYNISNCWIWHDGTDAIVGCDDARKEFLNVPTNSGEKFRIAAPLNASGRFKSECIGSALNYLFIPQDLMSTDYTARGSYPAEDAMAIQGRRPSFYIHQPNNLGVI